MLTLRSPVTLRRWRIRGSGPRYFRLGGRRGRVVYAERDLLTFLGVRSFGSTIEEAARWSKPATPPIDHEPPSVALLRAAWNSVKADKSQAADDATHLLNMAIGLLTMRSDIEPVFNLRKRQLLYVRKNLRAWTADERLMGDFLIDELLEEIAAAGSEATRLLIDIRDSLRGALGTDRSLLTRTGRSGTGDAPTTGGRSIPRPRLPRGADGRGEPAVTLQTFTDHKRESGPVGLAGPPGASAARDSTQRAAELDSA